MPRQASGNTHQVALRIPEEWLARLDALISELAPPGVNVSRVDVVRVALGQGLDVLEKVHPRGKNVLPGRPTLVRSGKPTLVRRRMKKAPTPKLRTIR